MAALIAKLGEADAQPNIARQENEKAQQASLEAQAADLSQQAKQQAMEGSQIINEAVKGIETEQAASAVAELAQQSQALQQLIAEMKSKG